MGRILVQCFTGGPFCVPRGYELHDDTSVRQYSVYNSTLQPSQSVRWIISGEPQIVYGRTPLLQIRELLRKRLVILETCAKYKRIAEYGYALTCLTRERLPI
jgi:hypothetical protein